MPFYKVTNTESNTELGTFEADTPQLAYSQVLAAQGERLNGTVEIPEGFNVQLVAGEELPKEQLSEEALEALEDESPESEK